MHKLCFIIFNIFVGASRKTAHAILVPHYVHIYLIIFFVCITLCYVIVTLAHVYICMDISGNKLLAYYIYNHQICPSTIVKVWQKLAEWANLVISVHVVHGGKWEDTVLPTRSTDKGHN